MAIDVLKENSLDLSSNENTGRTYTLRWPELQMKMKTSEEGKEKGEVKKREEEWEHESRRERKQRRMRRSGKNRKRMRNMKEKE